jgi:hypothetical protein
MKKVKLGCAILLCLVVSLAFAQDKPTDTMDIVRDAMKAEKRAFVALNMGLTDAESKAFWPLYDDYQQVLKKINERLGNLINDYAEEYDTLTDLKARQLIDKHLAIEKEMTKLQESYLEKFSAALPAKKVMRYFQLENKIEAVIHFDLARRIPLAK